MARIKVLEYTFENETIKIPVNVSVNGRKNIFFYVNVVLPGM